MKPSKASAARQDRYLDVDHYGTLRVPASVWLSLVVLCRHWILILLVLFSARNGASTLMLGEGGIPWLPMLMELPAALLAVVAWYRQPAAPRWVRLAWRRGRELIALTALFNIAWTTKLLAGSEYWSLWPELFLGSCALLDATIVIALYADAYYRQLFNEFPEASATRETSASNADSHGRASS